MTENLIPAGKIAACHQLAERSRSHDLDPSDEKNHTFTISNVELLTGQSRK